MRLPTLEPLEVASKRVLVRADLNVPLDDGRIADDFRIRASLPTITHLLDRGAHVIVCSHLGRPKGVDERYRMAPVAARLNDLLARHVEVLENLRFDPGETSNDPEFARRLASNADAYVNDAFGASHRAHASIVGVPKLLPHAAGFLLEEEVRTLSRLLDDPPRPFVVVLGGAKVADKLGVLRNLLGRADRVLVGGGMCFTFIKAMGHDVGRSLVDDEHLDDVRALLGEKMLLPWDVVVAHSVDATQGTIVRCDEIPPDTMGLDIGPASADGFAREISQAGSVFWNGPLGVYEKKPFQVGTRIVAQALASCDGFTVTGGGDIAAALAAFGFADEVDFMSTGGGASLEFLEGRSLPGLEALIR